MFKETSNKLIEKLNSILFPIKMVIPQPIINKIPLLTTNEDIRIHEALKWIRGYVLDIGCGNNRLISEYRQKGGFGLGVDVFDWGAQDLLVEDTSDLPFGEATFDTVTMIACINHIPNRLDVMSEAYRILKPDGSLILTNLSPALSKIWHMYAFWDKDQHQRGMREGEVFGLNDIEVEALATKSGFLPKMKRGFSWNLNTIYVYRKHLHTME
jgi:SAM-dependent methyltransferase